MIQKPLKIENWDDLNKVVQDWYNNLGLDDLRGTGVRTAAPTVASLDAGRSVIVEISNVPTLYYKTLNGTLYKQLLTAV